MKLIRSQFEEFKTGHARIGRAPAKRKKLNLSRRESRLRARARCRLRLRRKDRVFSSCRRLSLQRRKVLSSSPARKLLRATEPPRRQPGFLPQRDRTSSAVPQNLNRKLQDGSATPMRTAPEETAPPCRCRLLPARQT